MEAASLSNIIIAAYDANDESCFQNPSVSANSLSSAVVACRGEVFNDCRGNAASLAVCAPDMTVTIAQEHPYPGCGGPPAVLGPQQVHEGSPYNLTRAVEYSTSEKDEMCATEKKKCDLHNTISITMKPNIEVPAGTVVTVSGLNNAIDLELSTVPAWIRNDSFTFNTSEFVVMFEVNSTWSISEERSVQFSLINPSEAQESPEVSIRLAWTTDSDCHGSSMIEIAKLIEKMEGDAEVLKIESPRWITHDISQSTKDPQEENMISVSLVANVELRQGATITLSGLTGFASEDGHLALNESSYVVQTCLREEKDSNITQALQATGSWNQDLGTLVVTLNQTVPVHSGLKFSFVLTNPCVEHVASVSLHVNDKPFACDIDCHCPKVNVSKTVQVTVFEDYKLDCNGTTEFESNATDACNNTRAVLQDKTVYELVDGNCTCQHTIQGNDCALPPSVEVASVEVVAPKFTAHSGLQSTCWPENDNCATIAFKANVKFENGSKLYIAGFAGASDLGNSTSPVGAEHEWDERRKLITLSYSSTVAAHASQEVKICFKNPSQAQRAPEIAIWATNLCKCVVRIPKIIIPPALQECSRVLAVEAPKFINPKITQCHPYVSAMNIITATIATNVAMTRPRKVTISGLVGSMTPDNKGMLVFDGAYGSCESGCSGTVSSIFEPTGQWTRDRGMLILNLRENITTTPGEVYTVQFELENPPMEQKAPAVSISACKIAATRMHSDGGRGSVCGYIDTGTTAPPGCECIGRTKTLELLASVPSKHSVSKFGRDYGSYCAAWEDGACSSGTHTVGPLHSCGTLAGCDELWPSYDFDADQSWCCDSWCYVNQTTCTADIQKKYGLKVEKSWLNVTDLFYSYEVCQDDQTAPKNVDYERSKPIDKSYAHFTRETCPYNPARVPVGEDDMDAPLKILRPKIVGAHIGQSTMAPGEVNTISVTLSVNTPVRPDPAEGLLIISGFNNAIAPCGPLALFSDKSSHLAFMSSHDGVPGTGLWDCDHQSLVLHVAEELQPCDTYVFSWRVTNPLCSQTCDPIELRTQHLEFRLDGCGDSEACRRKIPAGMHDVMLMTPDTGSRCPMTVVAPSLTVMKVSECTSVCGMANRLDILLEANVPLDAGTSITIGGLSHGESCSVQADEAGMVAIQGRDAGFFNGKAMLLPSCEVTLLLVEGKSSNSRLEFCVPALNPDTGCFSPAPDAQGVQLSVWTTTPKYSLGPYTMSGTVLSGKDQPALEVAEISESSTVQRSMNTLKIMFRSNVEIEAGSHITITGLTGTAANRATDKSTAIQFGDAYYDVNPLQVTGMSSHYFKQDLTWDPILGTLELTTTTAIQAKSNMIISIQVQNGPQEQPVAVDPKISIHSPRTSSTPLSLCTRPEQEMFELIGPTDIKGTVLKSTCQPSLEMHKIGQSSPYPQESNMLTVTLATNFDYRARTGDKIVCTLSGLEGAVKNSGEMTLYGADPFSSGCMSCVCPSSLECGADKHGQVQTQERYMTFHIAGDIDAGCPYSFGFEVKNTMLPQSHPPLRLTCAWNDVTVIQAVDMVHDMCSVPTNIFDARVGEAAALVVRADTFSTRTIRQSNPYPCASNTICVELVSTIPLSEEKGDVIVISGLADAEAVSGDIALFSNISPDLDFLRSSSDKSAIPSTGRWDNAEKALEAHVRCRLEAGHRLRFCFTVQNPRSQRLAAKTSIQLKGGNSMDMQTINEKLSLPGSTILDSHPMFIRAPQFIRLNTEQTSPFPCDQNLVSIAFKVNVDLYSACNVRLTCSGFSSSLADDQDLGVTLTHVASNGTALTTANASAAWTSQQGRFVVGLAEPANSFGSGRIMDSESYLLNFTLKNWNALQGAAARIACNTGAADIQIPSTSATCNEKIPDKVQDRADKVCQGNSLPCGEEDSCPLSVHRPAFLTRNIGQSTAYPGASNMLCVTISTNVADFHSGSTLRISGFAPASRPATEMKMGAPYTIGFGGSGHGSDGVDCDMTNHSALLYVMFTATNVRERWNNVTKNNADHLVCVKRDQDTWKYFANGAWLNFSHHTSDLIVTKIVYDASWEFTNLAASNPKIHGIAAGSMLCSAADASKLRCTDVVISLFDYKKDALHCPDHLTLRVTGDFIMPSDIILEGPDASMFSSAMASSPAGLEVQVATGQSLSLAEDYSFCFYVQNPTTGASSYAVSISAVSCADIDETVMLQNTDPLHVVEKELVASAHQSNPFPCSSNTITLELTFNFHVRSAARITLTGLSQVHSSTAADGKLAIADASGGYDHAELFRRSSDDSCGEQYAYSEDTVCAPTAAWSSNNLILTVAAGKNLIAGERYSVSFEIENPHIVDGRSVPEISFESAPELFIGLSDETGASLSNVVVANSQSETLGLCGNDKADTAPLFVYKPELTVYKIGQSSAMPCDENVISVSLKANMPLCDPCSSALTLSGLEGAIIPDGPVALSPILTGGSHARDHLVFAAAEGGEAGYGMWSSASKTLTLFLTCCLECNFEYQFKFHVSNPQCSQAAPAISLEGDGLIEKKQMESQPAAPHIVLLAGPAAPLGIIQPTFTTHVWHEKSKIPCDNNTLSITLASNIPVPAGMVVTITELQDMATAMNELRTLPSNRTEYINSSYDALETSRGFNYSNSQWQQVETLLSGADAYSDEQRRSSDYRHRQQLLTDLQCQMVEDNCPGPFTNCDSVIGYRGAPLGYPDHTKEGYEAAVEMGACKLSCEAVFNKDGDLFCRQDRCDLHYTTDILTNSDNECLAKKCSRPFQPGQGALCCASDFTAEELQRLCVTQEMDRNSDASTVELYLSLPAWKAPSHSSVCHKIISHQDFIGLAVSHKKQMVVELLDDQSADVVAAAKRLLLDYTNSSVAVSESDVFLQSANKQHVHTWLTSPKFNQAVLRITQTGSATADLDELASLTSPLKFVSAHHSLLISAEGTSAIFGNSWTQTPMSRHAKQHGMSVWATGFTGSELRASASSSDYLQREADWVLLLHGLLANSVSAVFTDWAEKVSHYENCVTARSSTVNLEVKDGSLNSSVPVEWVVGDPARTLKVPIPQRVSKDTNFVISFDLEVRSLIKVNSRELGP